MEIPKIYNPVEKEAKWYQHWLNQGYFKSTPDEREAYTIVIPPPNVTGVLHMGHMLNNTIQDVLIRKARMQGFNACWVPGTDHASIATEAKVVNKLKAEGIDKDSLTRDEFMTHAWEWKEKHGGIILEQLKKLGASCDWDRTHFTMDEDYSKAVIKVFVDLYNKGFIYRGFRMVNWDSKALTAVSDEEVIYKEVQSKLYHIRYQIEGTNDYVTIATTRPETILGDSAICVNPNDERYQHLKGKRAIVPMVNRSVPIIFDEYVDVEFGTGCLKVTPAHDINDYELGKKHNLEVIDILTPTGVMSEAAQFFVGENRFDVRKKIVQPLEEAGALVKVEEYTNKVGFSERTDEVIEPRVSIQWFLNMKELAKPALEAVETDEIKLYPPKFKNTYRHWMENVHDWCISRQLWWGHQIPAFYYGDGPNDFVVAETAEEAAALATEKLGKSIAVADLKQDNDVLDTWASSWLWPIAVFDGINNPDNEEINYYYPTNDLVTAPEILFFWVARMIIAGKEYRNEIPFKNVYLTGIVRDKLGRKMSKSLGNSPDPIELIEKYGADGVRVGMLLTSPAGNDLPFDESLCEQGRNFSNKIWNALRLVSSWEVADVEQSEVDKTAGTWFRQKLYATLVELNEQYEKYRMSDALMLSYKLVWDEFCSWYLEFIKPAYQQPTSKATKAEAVEFFEILLKVMHPFMPFITEEIWHLLKERGENESIMLAKWPQPQDFNAQQLQEVEFAKEVIAGIRTVRKEHNIANKNEVELHVINNGNTTTQWDSLITKLGNVSQLSYTTEKPSAAQGFMVGSNEYFVPLGDAIDVEAQLEKLEKELVYNQGFLKSVLGKLKNERFVNNAPEQVVAIERKKQADAEAKIAVIEQQIAELKK